eukprot:GHRQ01017240.1.p1 GENE.GHRQ01017240.1~~GHRQ01017240.1.p1  ORF type:complete len:157 (-),score=8.29 GHRQ01017240.1:178-648(-)
MRCHCPKPSCSRRACLRWDGPAQLTSKFPSRPCPAGTHCSVSVSSGALLSGGTGVVAGFCRLLLQALLQLTACRSGNLPLRAARRYVTVAWLSAVCRLLAVPDSAPLPEDNKICITDLNSTNGTVVNGQELGPLDNIEVEVGAEVIFGEWCCCRAP